MAIFNSYVKLPEGNSLIFDADFGLGYAFWGVKVCCLVAGKSSEASLSSWCEEAPYREEDLWYWQLSKIWPGNPNSSTINRWIFHIHCCWSKNKLIPEVTNLFWVVYTINRWMFFFPWLRRQSAQMLRLRNTGTAVVQPLGPDQKCSGGWIQRYDQPVFFQLLMDLLDLNFLW